MIDKTSEVVRLQNAVAATGNGNVMDVSDAEDVAIQVTGTFSATVSFEGSIDGANFVALSLTPIGSATPATSTTLAGIWRGSVAGLRAVRTPVTWTSGTSVTVLGSKG